MHSLSKHVLASIISAAFLGEFGMAEKLPPQHVANILLIHGAFADSNNWHKVIPLLKAEGLHVVTLDIPLTSLAEDVAVRRKRSHSKAVLCFWSVTPTVERPSPRSVVTQKSRVWSTSLPTLRGRERQPAGWEVRSRKRLAGRRFSHNPGVSCVSPKKASRKIWQRICQQVNSDRLLLARFHWPPRAFR
jgi:hypothetical protein